MTDATTPPTPALPASERRALAAAFADYALRFPEEAALAAEFAALLRQKLGVEMSVVLVAPGALAPLTGIEVRQKPVRLIDKRFA